MFINAKLEEILKGQMSEDQKASASRPFYVGTLSNSGISESNSLRKFEQDKFYYKVDGQKKVPNIEFSRLRGSSVGKPGNLPLNPKMTINIQEFISQTKREGKSPQRAGSSDNDQSSTATRYERSELQMIEKVMANGERSSSSKREKIYFKTLETSFPFNQQAKQNKQYISKLVPSKAKTTARMVALSSVRGGKRSRLGPKAVSQQKNHKLSSPTLKLVEASFDNSSLTHLRPSTQAGTGTYDSKGVRAGTQTSRQYQRLNNSHVTSDQYELNLDYTDSQIMGAGTHLGSYSKTKRLNQTHSIRDDRRQAEQAYSGRGSFQAKYGRLFK